MKAKELIKKANRVWKEEGGGYASKKNPLIFKKRCQWTKNIIRILKLHGKAIEMFYFINGCYLEHPSRYRVVHQREQLEAGNLTTAQIFYKELSLELVKKFSNIYFLSLPLYGRDWRVYCKSKAV